MFYTNGNYLDSELREELIRIRFEIIERCSEVIHHDYEGTNGPNTSNPLRIRNYIHFPVNSRHHSDGKMYRFVYEEYRFPYLVKIIDKLLRGNYSVVDELENIDLSKELVPFEEKLEILSSELDSIPNRSIREKREKLNELEYYLIQSEYNKRQVSVIPYYQRVLDIVRKHNVSLVLSKGNV